MLGGGENGADAFATLARPDGVAAVSKTYTVPIAVQPGRRLLRIDFSATDPTTGTTSTYFTLATTTLNVTVQNDGTLRTIDGKALGAVGFTSNVAFASGQAIETRATANLGVTATSVNGMIAALPASIVSFRIVSGAEFLRLNADGSFTGLASGTATVVPTVDNVSGEPVVVTVLRAPITAQAVALDLEGTRIAPRP